METQNKEKTATLTLRLPISRIEDIKRMAEALGLSASKLASTLVLAGFAMTDEWLKQEGDSDGSI